MEQSTRRRSVRGFAGAAVMAAVLGMAGCAHWGSQEDLPVTEISRLQASGAVLPFSRLNNAVIARHPGSTVEHAALDKMGERYLYQASLSDPNKMQWFVELDAKTGETVTDQQDAH